MKNYWNISQDHACFEYQFVLNKNKYDLKIIKELLSVIVLSGWKFGVLKILDKESGVSYCESFLNLFNSILDTKKNVNELENNYRFFQQAFPAEGDNNPHVIVTELAYYNESEEIVIKDVFTNEIFYKLLNPNRVHLYHHSETGTISPLSLELSIQQSRELKLRISSGLGIWLPYFKPDYDMDKQRLEEFPLYENGYIDNRELYFLNTPRLISFIKVIRKFYETNNGVELSNKNQLEQLPVFPKYGT